MSLFNKYRIVDLTRTMHPDMPGVDFDQARSLEQDGWNAMTLHLYSHVGTHMDAPLHFGVSSESIDETPPKRLLSKAWVVHIPDIQPSQLLLPRDVSEIESQIQPGDSLLLRTDWSQIQDYDTFRNKLPRISEGLAQWCVEKEINILGVEPPSVADVNNLEEVTHIHHILMKGNVIIVEGLVNLDQLTAPCVDLIALPLKIHNGDGSPIRALALEPQ